MEGYRLRMTKGCRVAGQGCAEGEVIDVDLQTAMDLLHIGYAEPADAATAACFRTAPRVAWKDPDAEHSVFVKRVA